MYSTIEACQCMCIVSVVYYSVERERRNVNICLSMGICRGEQQHYVRGEEQDKRCE